jgi:hypothetical protein
LSKEDNGAMIIDLEKYKLGKTIVRKRVRCVPCD